VVLDANKEILRVRKNETFAVPRDGYFVPDARMLEIGEALNQEILKLKKD
jgi:hypothetical protein